MGIPIKKQILCVDDTEDDCTLFSFVLSEAGYEVKSAGSFAEAVALLESKQFNLCLTDLSMTDGTGLELIQKIRAAYPSMPIVICSGDARDAARQSAAAANVQAFFVKPVDIEQLAKTVTQLLG